MKYVSRLCTVSEFSDVVCTWQEINNWQARHQSSDAVILAPLFTVRTMKIAQIIYLFIYLSRYVQHRAVSKVLRRIMLYWLSSCSLLMYSLSLDALILYRSISYYRHRCTWIPKSWNFRPSCIGQVVYNLTVSADIYKINLRKPVVTSIIGGKHQKALYVTPFRTKIMHALRLPWIILNCMHNPPLSKPTANLALAVNIVFGKTQLGSKPNVCI